MNSRRGLMLLEVGVAMTAAAVLLYGAVFLFSSFQRIDRTARVRVQTIRELARLAEQFRGDVYAAREVEAAGDRPLIRLVGPENNRVEYSVGENRQLVRTLANAEKIVERDVFDLGPGVDYSIDIARDRNSLVTLAVAMSRNANAEGNPPKIQRRVTALLSRDARYEVGLPMEEAQ